MSGLKAKTDSELKILLEALVNRLQPLFGERLKKVILFGSYARGDYDEESDIDIMLLLNEDEEILKEYSDKISEIIVDLDLEYNVVLSTILQSERKFSKYLETMPFYNNVKKEGVVFYEQ